MSEHGITFPPEMMQQIVSKALIEGMGQEVRDSLIEQAVQALLVPTKINTYDARATGPTPIQTAFDNAARSAVNQVAREVLEEDETFKARVKELMLDAVAQALSDPASSGYSTLREEIVAAVAGVIGRADVKKDRF